MLNTHPITKQLVRSILERPMQREWSLQGFGMLRTYLDDDKVFRLHIWNPDLAVENVSSIHTHPWDFTSLVVAGVVENVRYDAYNPDILREAPRYNRQLILCGPGGCVKGDPERIKLIERNRLRYREGEAYRQVADDLHESRPARGTVTVIQRVFGSDVDHAYVFFPANEQWVSAEPRPATDKEIISSCVLALERWFK